MASHTLQQQAAVIEGKIKTLVNNDLKEICRQEGLQVSGVKASLQMRIIERLRGYVTSGDHEAVQRIRYRASNHGGTPPPGALTPSASSYTSTSPTSAMPTYSSPNAYARPAYGGGSSNRPIYRRTSDLFGRKLWKTKVVLASLLFKDSPFYEVKEALTNKLELPPYPNNRSTVESQIVLPQEICDQLQRDDGLKVMLYSSAESTLQPYMNKHDVAFPQNIEVRVNGEEVKTNFKGLKNKAGSTKPADITNLVKKTAGYTNTLRVIYALTQKVSASHTKLQKFYMVVNLVRKHSVRELTDRIRKGNVFSKDRVIREMISKANDPDIVATSTVMSLKDPVSFMRIKLPCRTTICSHNQCFDASWFLDLQEQAPTWTCPVCSKVVTFQSLVVDQYVEEILSVTPESTEQVTIEPNGKWTQGNNMEGANGGGGGYDDDEDSDDLVEIHDPRAPSVKAEPTNSASLLSLARTPPHSSREASAASSALPPPRSGGAKRTSDVIDLTIDDEDEPPRPAKRVAYNTPNSMPESNRNGYGQNGYPQSSYSRPPNGVRPFTMPTNPPSSHTSQPSRQLPPLEPPPDPRYFDDMFSNGTYRR